MEDKATIYNTPKIYKDCGTIYNGNGVYNSGYNSTPASSFIYKTDFTNFDVNTKIDIPEIGQNLSFTVEGTQNFSVSEDGLLIYGAGDIYAIIPDDFTSYTKITRRYKGNVKSLPSNSWCGLYGSYFSNNVYNRGAGCLFLDSNVNTQFIPIMNETFMDGCTYIFAVKASGQYYVGQDIEITEIWEIDGTIKYYWNDELIGTCSGVAMDENLNKHFKYVYFYAERNSQIYHKKLELEVE